MKVGVIGTGYVGLVTGTCLAEMGNDITCVDVDENKIRLLKDGVIPIYEPGLESLVKSNSASGRLQFTTDIQSAVKKNDILMIAVGTPPTEDGSADLQHVLNVAESIGQYLDQPKVVVTKSTVPVGTGQKVRDTIGATLKNRGESISFSIASNPEFLKEGAAVGDFMKPDRIVVGCEDDFSKEKLRQLYHPFVLNGHRVIYMDVRSAELTKYAANALLATKISFMNEVSRVAERVGADIGAVRNGIGSDPRIGFHFIYPGIGYGGSCFPKDVQALVRTAREHQENLSILEAVENVNKTQRHFFIDKIKGEMGPRLQDKCFALWGLSFKPETDDIREAPSIDIITELVEAGATIKAFDPIANKNIRKHFETHRPEFLEDGKLKLYEDQYDPILDADALVLVTEWKPFRSPNFQRMKELMKTQTIFDGRNQYEPDQMKALGYKYISIGRPSV